MFGGKVEAKGRRREEEGPPRLPFAKLSVCASSVVSDQISEPPIVRTRLMLSWAILVHVGYGVNARAVHIGWEELAAALVSELDHSRPGTDE